MDAFNFSSYFLSFFSTSIEIVFGAEGVAGVHDLYGMACRLMTMNLYRRGFGLPLWQVIVLTGITLAVGWKLERQIRIGRNRVLNDFDVMMNVRKTLNATAIASQGRVKISANVDVFGSSYTLNMTTESPHQPKATEQHHFTSASDFFKFLEKNTILRSGDFK